MHGDLMQPNLGLDDDEYRALAKSIDAIIHCAAVTDFNRRDGSLETTNVQGTEKIIALAGAADARLYHVSTAFLHAKADGDRGRTAVGYADSKRAAEDLVQASSVPHVMLRPSVGHRRLEDRRRQRLSGPVPGRRSHLRRPRPAHSL